MVEPLGLFSSYEIHRTGMLQGWVHGLGSMRFGLAVQKFLNIE